ncbi:MAG TPA: pseudouridine synthase [Ideonella sp.]|nr:pseudouridine synthase [Ideonella sp.]
MATLKLPGRRKPSAPARAPLRGRGVQPRPTLDQARQRRDEHPPLRRDEAAPARRDPAAPPHEGMRLSKRMSELGLASRREADEWIAQGLVRVDGKVVAELGARVRPGQSITIDPAAHREQSQRVTILLHKPLGYVSGQPEDDHLPAVALVTAANRWSGDRTPLRFAPVQLRGLAPAGRLDLDSTGLLVLTQDGRIARALIGERSNVEKEYLVRVDWADPREAAAHAGTPLMHAFPAERMARLRHGLVLDGVELQPAKVSWQSEFRLRFVLREGRKRQIRRMCEAVGLKVVALERVRIGSVVLGALPLGQWRYLGPFERF